MEKRVQILFIASCIENLYKKRPSIGEEDTCVMMHSLKGSLQYCSVYCLFYFISIDFLSAMFFLSWLHAVTSWSAFYCIVCWSSASSRFELMDSSCLIGFYRISQFFTYMLNGLLIICLGLLAFLVHLDYISINVSSYRYNASLIVRFHWCHSITNFLIVIGWYVNWWIATIAHILYLMACSLWL